MEREINIDQVKEIMQDGFQSFAKVLANVFCPKCRVTTIKDYAIYLDKSGDIILRGSCSKCNHAVARVMETGETPKTDNVARKIYQEMGSKVEMDRKKIEKMMRGFEKNSPIRPKKNKALGQAQEIIWNAWETRDQNERIKMAHEALSVSLDCADAYVLLAQEDADNHFEALLLYRKGIKAGERSLGKRMFKDNIGHFWGIIETRPYMRALAGLAQSLDEMGQADEAILQYRNLLVLNPSDNQGTRYLLSACLAKAKKYDELEALLKTYPGDFGLHWVYAYPFLSFVKTGDSPKAKKLLSEAIKRNKFVVDYLAGKKKMPKYVPDSYALNSEDEAICYVYDFLQAWEIVPGAIDWLQKSQA